MADTFYEDLDFAFPSYPKDAFDDYGGEDHFEDEEDVDVLAKFDGKSEELACPFCLEDFDVLGLCCHIDADHRAEVKPGFCPLCTKKVATNMASHVIGQHESILEGLGNLQHHTNSARSSLILIRKEIHERHLRRIKDSSAAETSSDPATDSSLLSFVNSAQGAESSPSSEGSLSSSSEAALPSENFNDNSSERTQPSVSSDRSIEKAQRSEFLQGLVFSSMFDDL